MNFIESFFASQLTVLSLMYNCIKVTDGSRILYLQKFPPANASTSSPSPEDPDPTPEQLVPDKISRATLESIWFGTGINSGRRRLGRQNLPTTDDTWCTDVFIGDQVQILDAREGILGLKTPWNHTTPVVPGSEHWAWTGLVQVHGKKYKVYLTSQPMPQRALDVLLVIKVAGKLWIKLLRRGSDPNTVDFPWVLMSGAGEHLEPGTSTPKQDIKRSLSEESGFDPDDYQGVKVIELGTFSNPERDPRYTIFNGLDVETGEPVHFGEVRGSSTTLKLVYVEFGGSTLPVQIPHTDLTEVAYTFWCELDDAIRMDPKEFILEENHSYLQIVKNYLQNNTN
jgi:ADP-ribose pyrophosphatase YjhB (NUDIX family)